MQLQFLKSNLSHKPISLHKKMSVFSPLYHLRRKSSFEGFQRFISFSKNSASSSSSSELHLHHHLPNFHQILSKKPGSILTSSTPLDDELIKYNQDWTKKFFGKSQIVLKPSSTEEVSQLLAYCQKHAIGVVPQGGNTSLVGGGIALFQNDIILSLERMNRIIYHDTIGGILTCEAGCILQDLETFLHERTNCTLPYDLGAKGSCQIGGNIATNAGGLRLVRYGNLHGLVLGLEVVLPNGEILRQNMLSVPVEKNNNDPNHHHRSIGITPETKAGKDGKEELGKKIHTSLRKDNTGYDLKQLFIGSEGTLGVITKVSIHTPTISTTNNVTLLTLHPHATMEDIARIFLESKNKLNEILSAFEFWDKLSHELVDIHNQPSLFLDLNKEKDEEEESLGSSSSKNNQKYILIETLGSNESHDQEKLMNFLEEQLALPLLSSSSSSTSSSSASPETIIQEGILAKDLSEVKQLWSRRELIPVAAAAHPETIVVFKYDLSLPQMYMYEPIEQTRKRLQSWWNEEENDPQIQKYFQIPFVIGFGHFGDGNIHLNILLRKKLLPKTLTTSIELEEQKQLVGKYQLNVRKIIEPWIYEQITNQWKGSISAEHGIGIQKTSYLPKIKTPIELKIMKSIKDIFDPKGIMNRGKLFVTYDDHDSPHEDGDSKPK